MKRYLFFFLLFFVFYCRFSTLNSLYALTQKDLDASLRYYSRISRQQNLTPNDKLAVLLRIKAKYKNYKLDFTRLNKEIAVQEKLRRAASKQTPAPVTDTLVSESQKFPAVKDIKLEETSDSINIKIVSGKAESYSSFLLRDPDPIIAPKIILDMYGVVESVPQKEMRVGSSNIEKVKIGQFKKEPNPIVRAVVFLKKPANYTVHEIGDGFLISIKKDKSEIKKDVSPPLSAVSPKKASLAKQMETATALKKNEYKIESGDVLAVNIYPAEELSREVVVSPNGEISLPLIGVVNAKNVTTAQLSKTLRKRYSKFITSPDVSVVVKQYARRQVFIMGEIKSAGGFPYKENLRLMELISTAGGFSEKANRREVKIYRGIGPAKKTFRVNVEEILKSGDFTKDFLLEPGDIIEVSVGSNKISILGDVVRPGHYDYRENMKLIEALSLAGGFSESAEISRVTVLRKEGNITKSIKVNVSDILKGKKADIPLNPDDTIYLPKKTISSAGWWLQNVMPWLSLISLILAIRAGI